MEQAAVVFEEVARLADAELIVGLQRWVRADRSLTARLLVHLGEVDARGLYRERAWPSMFAYAVEELHMSESEAYMRIAAARLGRQFPRVVELLAQGALHLTAIKLLGPHLTADNHVQVLERARGKVTREIERLVAELAPKPDAPSRIRKLPAPVSGHAVGTPVARLREANASSSLFAAHPAETASSTPTCAVRAQPEEVVAACGCERGAHRQFQLEPTPRNVSSTTPLRPGRYRVEFTAGEAMHGKLEQLKALLRHQVPDGDLAIILERAADLLIEKTRKERFAQTARPRVSKMSGSNTRASESGGHEADASAAAAREAITSAAAAREAITSAAGAREASTNAAGAREASTNAAGAREASTNAAGAREASTSAAGAREAITSAAGAREAITSAAGAREASTSAAGAREASTSAAGAREASTSAAGAREAIASAAAAREAEASAAAAREAEASKPRANARAARPGHAHSRYIPRAVVREVYARDGEQCTFVSPDGRRCPERGFLELHHHDTPYARGGGATTANLRTICRTHNALLAEHDFGRAFIQSKLRHARSHKRAEVNELVLRRAHE